MAHSEDPKKLVEMPLMALDKRALLTCDPVALQRRLLRLATQADRTQDLCEVLRTMHARKIGFDVQDQDQDTVFHRLARTLGHDWPLLRQTFLEVLPRAWLRVEREQPPASYDPEPRSVLDKLDNVMALWFAQVSETVRTTFALTPFEKKNQAGQTPLALALFAQNLPFAQLAWDYNNHLCTPVRNENMQAEFFTWLHALDEYRAGEQGQALITWLMGALRHEVEKSKDDFTRYLNHPLEENGNRKWFGHYITCISRLGELPKVQLFDLIQQHGYVMTRNDQRKYTIYLEKIDNFSALCLEKNALLEQVEALASVVVSDYVKAVREWIVEKLVDSAKTLSFMSTSQEPAKRLKMGEMRDKLLPFFSANAGEAMRVFHTAIAAFEASILAEKPDSREAITGWLAAERLERQPAAVPVAVHASAVLQAGAPAILPAADSRGSVGSRSTTAASAAPPSAVPASTADPNLRSTPAATHTLH